MEKDYGEDCESKTVRGEGSWGGLAHLREFETAAWDKEKWIVLASEVSGGKGPLEENGGTADGFTGIQGEKNTTEEIKKGAPSSKKLGG